MTDKELLEYAAKAANKEIVWSSSNMFNWWAHDVETGCRWNPLEDSKDAFELMTTLKISVVMDSYEEYVCAQYSDYETIQFYEKIVYFSGDLAKDYKLAITTCAAKIALT